MAYPYPVSEQPIAEPLGVIAAIKIPLNVAPATLSDYYQTASATQGKNVHIFNTNSTPWWAYPP